MQNKKTLLKFLLFPLLFLAILFASKTNAATPSSLYIIDAWPSEYEGEEAIYIRNVDDETLEVIEAIEITSEEGSVEGSNGIAVDPIANTIYSILRINDDEGNGRFLATIDIETGEATIIGPSPRKIASIAFDNDGQLYGLMGEGDNTNPASLFEIDKETVNLTLLAEYDAEGDGEALTFSQEDELLYRATGPDLYAIDPSDPENPTTIYEGIDEDFDSVTAIYHIGGDDFYLADWSWGMVSINTSTEEVAEITSDYDNGGVKGFFDQIPSTSALSFYPKDNEINVLIDSNLEITFDREVYKGTGNITIKKTSNNSIVETVDITSNKVTGWGTDTITINPVNNFSYNTEFYINIDEGAIQDIDDSEYSGIESNLIWSFTTRPEGNSFSFEDDFLNNLNIDTGETDALWDESGNNYSLESYNWTQMDGVTPGYEDIHSDFSEEIMDGSGFVFDDSGNPIVSWSSREEGNSGVFVSRWNGAEWTQMDEVTPGYEVISDFGRVNSPKIVIDGSGVPIVAWLTQYGSPTESSVYVSRWNGSNWTGLENTGADQDKISEDLFINPEIPQIVIDNSGYPIIMFGNSYLTRWNGSNWTEMDSVTPGIDSGANPLRFDPVLNLDNFGNPVVVGALAFPGYNDLAAIRWNGSSWTNMDGITPGYEFITDSNVGEELDDYTFLIDDSNNIVVVWEWEKSDQDDIYISRWNGSSWTNMDGITPGYENISNTGGGFSPKLILNNSGNPIIEWLDRDQLWTQCNINISYWSGTAWTQMDGVTSGYDTIFDESIFNESPYPSGIILNSSGNPTVFFSGQASTGSDIFASFWNGTDWTHVDGTTLGYENVSNFFGQASYSGANFNDSDELFVIWNDSGVFISYYNPGIVSPATIQSITLNGLLEDNILRATLTASDETPGASRIEYFLSNNGGSTWEKVENGIEHIFSTTGNDLRWKAILYEGSTPTLESITLAYSTETEEADEEDDDDEEDDEEDNDEEKVKIKSIQEYCNKLDVLVDVENNEKEKLDFVVKFENLVTHNKDEIKFEDIKTDKNGKATLTLYPLKQGANYEVKVKFKNRGDSYSDWSNKKKANTGICYASTNITELETSSIDETTQNTKNNEDNQEKQDTNNQRQSELNDSNNSNNNSNNQNKETKKEKTGLLNSLVYGVSSLGEFISNNKSKTFWWLLLLIIILLIIWWWKREHDKKKRERMKKEK